jgi:hypothetical protein
MKQWKQHDAGPCGAIKDESTGAGVSVAPEFVGSPRWVARFFLRPPGCDDRGFRGPVADTAVEAIDLLFSEGRPSRALSGEFFRLARTLDRVALARYAAEPRD